MQGGRAGAGPRSHDGPVQEGELRNQLFTHGWDVAAEVRQCVLARDRDPVAADHHFPEQTVQQPARQGIVGVPAERLAGSGALDEDHGVGGLVERFVGDPLQLQVVGEPVPGGEVVDGGLQRLRSAAVRDRLQQRLGPVVQLPGVVGEVAGFVRADVFPCLGGEALRPFVLGQAVQPGQGPEALLAAPQFGLQGVVGSLVRV